MDRSPDALQALLALVPDPAVPGLRADCAGLARRIRERSLRSVGLVPADDDVAIPRVLLHLGHALAAGSDGAVGLVDAQGTWAGPTSWPAADADEDGQIAIRREVADHLVFMAPRVTLSASALRQLQYVLAREARSFERLLVDLTGFARLGEQLAACQLLDAVLLVARRGTTTVHSARRWMRELEGVNCLGILLTGT